MDRCKAVGEQIRQRVINFMKLLKSVTKSDRVRILVHVRLIVLLVLFAVSIWWLGADWIEFHFTNWENKLAKFAAKMIFLECVITGLIFVLETWLLVILFQAVKQNSFKKCLVWFIVSLVLFIVAVVTFFYELITEMGETSQFITLLLLLLDAVSFKIVYDFMQELRNPSIQFQPMASANHV